MGMSANERDKMYLPMFIISIGLVVITIYWFGYPFFYHYHLTVPPVDELLTRFSEGGQLQSSLGIKFWTLGFIIANVAVKAGKPTKASWKRIVTALVAGFLLFFWPFRFAPFFILSTFLGYVFLNNSIALVGRKIKGMKDPDNDIYETFEQCEKKIENEYSINIPTKYKWKGNKRNGWINVVAPFRASMVLGVPGSGKSFSVYNPFISQMMRKSYTCFLYDYKYPDLSEEIYNEYLLNIDNFKKKMNGKVPKFCVINFDDPRKSLRCNPIAPRYITDPADTSEIADIIMRNVNPQSIEKEDFFSLSAKVYIDAMIWYLRIFQDGRYCTFPHLIELMGRNYKSVFKILQKYDEIKVKIQPFQNALMGNAQEQLQGQIASAQIPLLRFASPALYWILSGDDFTLDINDKEDPKILCVGNNPDRQSIYGTTLALLTSRMFRQINHKGKYPCGVLLDELPTIFIKGIDNLIATARSNKVAIVLGAQDESQLRRDYGDKESEVVFNTVGNIFAGQVNGKTAKTLSETFGKEFRAQESETRGGENNTINRSFHQIEIMPQSRIETLTQGYFFGKIADNNDCRIDKKLFCGEIQIDMNERKRKEKNRKKIPYADDLIREYNRMMGRPEDEGVFKYFNDDAVKDRVMENKDDYLRDYVRDVIRKEERSKKYADEHYNMMPENSDEETRAVEQRIGEFSKENKEKILAGIVKEEQQKKVNEVLQDNYTQIKKDINNIFVMEGIPEYETDDKTDSGAAPSGTKPEDNMPENLFEEDDKKDNEKTGGIDPGSLEPDVLDLVGELEPVSGEKKDEDDYGV